MVQTWLNADGLRIWYGRDEGVDTVAGEYGAFESGSVHQVRYDIGPETVPAGEEVVHYSVRLPGRPEIEGFAGVSTFIKRAYLFVEEEFDAGSLRIGLKNLDGTDYDADGLAAGQSLAALAVGEEVDLTGAAIGLRLDNTSPLNVAWESAAAPTEGKGWLIVEYFVQNI